MAVYASTVERESPRRRLWYWRVTRDGATASAGFQKTKPLAEQRAAEEIAHHRAVDATITDRPEGDQP